MSLSRLPFLLVALALPALAQHSGRTTAVTDSSDAIVPAGYFTEDSPEYDAGLAGPYVADEPFVLAPADTPFARLIERLSEPGGYFDSDNLISNEASYLHVMGALERRGVRGGAYIGVGPDQNFSYMARIRPEIAFIIDIRRDNLLQHFLLKALFANARNRLEYLCLLFGRPVPADLARWDRRDIDELIAYLDGTPSEPEAFESAVNKVAATVQTFGYPLSESDLATIRRFHTAFYDAGPSIRFTSYGRSARVGYPSYRQLLTETDLDGRRGNYLVREEDFRFLKSLQAQNRVIPVVGDLAGDHALAAIGEYLRQQGLRVSAFYTSNVEFYLMADGSFDRYARNVRRLPADENSVIIRSYFGRGYPHPQAVPGYYSTQLLQGLRSFAEDETAGGYRSYADLVTRRMIELRN